MTTEAPALLGIEHYIYRKDGKVYLHRVGDGDPIIFLHSVSSHAAAWKHIVNRLSRHFACYTVDMPGHDHSDIPPRKYSMEDYADAILAGIPQIKPTFLDIAPSGIPSNIIPHSKGVKCGLIRSNSPFSYSNHRPAKPKIPKPLVYAQVSPLGTSFATP